MFTALSILLAITCLVPAGAKLSAHPKMQESARHFGIPWSRYRLIGAAELAAAAGVVAGLWWHPIGVGAAAGHDRDLGQARARRLPGHHGHRAERHQPDRHLRAALRQPDGQRPAASVRARCRRRRTSAGQRGAGLRPRAADLAVARQPGHRCSPRRL
jgi:hypothetical protein